MELFCILIVVVTQIYKYVKIHRTVQELVYILTVVVTQIQMCYISQNCTLQKSDFYPMIKKILKRFIYKYL